MEADDNLSLPTPSSCLKVGIAINGNKRSKYIVRWALDKFVQEGNVVVKLIYVYPRIVAVPTASKICYFCSIHSEKRGILLCLA